MSIISKWMKAICKAAGGVLDRTNDNGRSTDYYIKLDVLSSSAPTLHTSSKIYSHGFHHHFEVSRIKFLVLMLLYKLDYINKDRIIDSIL